MSWEEVHDILKNRSNLKVARPLIQQHAPNLMEAVNQGLAKEKPDLELATLAIHEFTQRKSSRADSSASKIMGRMIDIGHEPIPWLITIRNNLRLLKFEHKPNENYTNSLYVILRDGYTKKNGRYGVYVGQTTKTPEERFSQHINGINSGHGLVKHGIQLLHSLMWPWQKIPGAQRLYYESALHKALELNNLGGPVVSGDAINAEEWPEGFQKYLFKEINAQK